MVRDRYHEQHKDFHGLSNGENPFETGEAPPTYEGQALFFWAKQANGEMLLVPITKFEIVGTATVEIQELSVAQRGIRLGQLRDRRRVTH